VFLLIDWFCFAALWHNNRYINDAICRHSKEGRKLQPNSYVNVVVLRQQNRKLEENLIYTFLTLRNNRILSDSFGNQMDSCGTSVPGILLEVLMGMAYRPTQRFWPMGLVKPCPCLDWTEMGQLQLQKFSNHTKTVITSDCKHIMLHKCTPKISHILKYKQQTFKLLILIKYINFDRY